jgi:hypothetical protein
MSDNVKAISEAHKSFLQYTLMALSSGVISQNKFGYSFASSAKVKNMWNTSISPVLNKQSSPFTLFENIRNQHSSVI